MRQQLRPVPDTPPRAVLYLRQSISREDSISLEIQEASCREYCRQQGYQVMVIESDPNISGRTWKRPAVQRVMDLVESGGADVVVLWKWSRLSRSRKDWAVAADRVEVAGGRIESATEQVDVATSTGRLARGMLVEFAAFESDRIGEVWKEVHGSRLARGLLPGGQARYGYQLVDGSPVQVPDPDRAPLLARMYEEYVAGVGFRRIAVMLNDEGHRTMRGRLWKGESVADALDSGFGAGLIKWNDVLHPGAHDAVIDQDLWQRYLDRRASRRQRPSRSKGSPYALSGLLRCSECEGPMVAAVTTTGRTPASYRCRRRTEFGDTTHPGGCNGGSVRMARVNQLMLDALDKYGDRLEARAETAPVAAVEISSEGESRRLLREIADLEQEISNLTQLVGQGVVRPEDYTVARDLIDARIVVTSDRLEELQRDVREARVDRTAIAEQLVDEWDDLPVDVRQTMLRDLVDHVVVTSSPAKPTRYGKVSTASIDPVWR